jgi:hypothetical protein
MFSTFHTYPELLMDRGRLAQSCWDHASDLGAAIAATLAYNPDAVILRATGSGQQLRGLPPAAWPDPLPYRNLSPCFN